MEDNIDNLLDDLDALITNKSPVISSANGFTESFPFRVPHRPPNEKSPTQQNNPNPKNKFAISPSVTHSGSYQTPSFRSENIRSQNSYSSSSSSLSSTSGASSNSSLSKNAGMESIDSLLEMFDEPSKPQPSATFQYSGSSGNRNSNSDSSSFKQLPTQTYSSSHGSSSSSYQPSTNSSSTSASLPSFDRPTKQRPDAQSSSSNSSCSYTADNSFDSLLFDINSSLPPVSPTAPRTGSSSSSNGNSNYSTTYSSPAANGTGGASSSSTASSQLKYSGSNGSVSLLQPPPQGGAGGGSARCSRVVIAGSAVSRGAKTSAFSKSACDRLRCLQCNFEAIQFPGQAWSGAVEYMFFRNNMPNRSKLAAELVPAPASVAYCCQCSWISTEEEQTLSAGQPDKPQWVCAGGH